jgi:hypothetical protein
MILFCLDAFAVCSVTMLYQRLNVCAARRHTPRLRVRLYIKNRDRHTPQSFFPLSHQRPLLTRPRADGVLPAHRLEPISVNTPRSTALADHDDCNACHRDDLILSEAGSVSRAAGTPAFSCHPTLSQLPMTIKKIWYGELER